MSSYLINSQTGERTLITNTIPLGAYKDQRIDEMRVLCSQAIVETAGIDDKTQLNAIAGIYPPERCEAIKSYIAACRNEYLRCKELILTAQTNDEADAVSFSAPSVPQNLGS